MWADAAPRACDPLPTRHVRVEAKRTGSAASVLSRLSPAVTLAAIEARRGELWMLHAAGLSDAEGRVVVLIGPSGRGKTTAARALGRRWGYVSDETIGIGPDATVMAYRKPLSVIEDSAEVKAQRSATELGLRDLPDRGLRLSAIVLLDRDEEGPASPVVETCELVDALPELIAQSSHLADQPRPLRTIADLVSSIGGVRRIRYREAESLGDVLESLFQTPSEVEGASAAQPAAGEVGSTGYFRGPYIDALDFHDADTVALLQPEPSGKATFRLLGGIGPALWRAATGASLEQLTAAVLDQHGAPHAQSPEHLVQTAIDELVRQHVLEPEASWRVRPGVAFTSGGERPVALALDIEQATPVALDGSAAVIWDLLVAARAITATGLASALGGHFEVEVSEVRATLDEFLVELESRSLVERFAP